MPLTKRIVEPVNVGRVHVPCQGLTNDLECVTNHTLANVIRQLSGVSKMAEDLFSELADETRKMFGRALQLHGRVESVQNKVTQLNSTVEEVNLQDIHLKKPYRSSITKDQQVISRSTIPRSVLEVYSLCDLPPCLGKLNKFREDGRDSLKFYTDPTYFVELWVREIDKEIQENETELNKKRERRRKPRSPSDVKKPREIKDSREKWRAQAQGQEFYEMGGNHLLEQASQQQSVPDCRPPSYRQSRHRSHHHHQQQQQQATISMSASVGRRHNSDNRPGSVRWAVSSSCSVSSSKYSDTYNSLLQHQHPAGGGKMAANGPYTCQQQGDRARQSNVPDTHTTQQATPSTVLLAGGQLHLSQQPPLTVDSTNGPSQVVSNTKQVGSPQNRPSLPPPAPPLPGPSSDLLEQVLCQITEDGLPLPPQPSHPADNEPLNVHQKHPSTMHTQMMIGAVPLSSLSMGVGVGSALLPGHSSDVADDRLAFAAIGASPHGFHVAGAPSADTLPPPPPTPPPSDAEILPPPPLSPPQVIDGEGFEPPSPPPPPFPPNSLLQVGLMMNGHAVMMDQLDSASVSSNSTSTSGRDDSKTGFHGNDRSALLAEIIAVDKNKRLRRVEEIQERRRGDPFTGGFDIQAMMERARDMRRKVVEDSEEERDDVSSGDEWESD